MKLSIRPLALPEIKLIGAPRFRDERGYFAETYVRRDFAAAGIPHEFVQDNESLSHAPGTVRGLHFQIPPFAQAKLVRVLTGRIFDACVDLRRSSPRYGRHASHPGPFAWRKSLRAVEEKKRCTRFGCRIGKADTWPDGTAFWSGSAAGREREAWAPENPK